VAGLAVAGVSAYFARRASTAAEQARKAVLSGTLAEEISMAAKLAGEMTELIAFGKHELARLHKSPTFPQKGREMRTDLRRVANH